MFGGGLMNIKAVISNGLAYGKAIRTHKNESEHDIYSSNNIEECKLVDKAIFKAFNDLESLRGSNRDDDELINVQQMLIKDPILYTEVIELINDKHLTAHSALKSVFDEYIKKFNEARTTYLQERALDMEDVKRRVMLALDDTPHIDVEGEFILVTDSLYPSYLMSYDKQIIGVVALNGGYTSHSAILCKSREIPYVLVDDINEIDGNILIDTRKNIINLNPSEEDIDEYERIKRDKESFEANDFKSFGIHIFANVTSNNDLYKVLKYNMDGVGLYRTELIFMNLDRPMTYEEQYKIYSEACELMKDKNICFRTFDIGDDKQLSYIKTFHKGIDNYKNNKEVFETQIKALLDANKYGNMKIMFPMIETNEEFQYLKDWVLRIKKELNNDMPIQIGMMLETKKAVMNIESFHNIDFMSLGTNDLTKELYNISREDTLNYRVFIKDLIRTLRNVVDVLNEKGIGLSICGELASVKPVVRRLYRVGIKNFSVSTASARALNDALLNELEE